jgi:hypothetical protein
MELGEIQPRRGEEEAQHYIPCPSFTELGQILPRVGGKLVGMGGPRSYST